MRPFFEKRYFVMALLRSDLGRSVPLRPGRHASRACAWPTHALLLPHRQAARERWPRFERGLRRRAAPPRYAASLPLGLPTSTPACRAPVSPPAHCMRSPPRPTTTDRPPSDLPCSLMSLATRTRATMRPAHARPLAPGPQGFRHALCARPHGSRPRCRACAADRNAFRQGRPVGHRGNAALERTAVAGAGSRSTAAAPARRKPPSHKAGA